MKEFFEKTSLLQLALGVEGWGRLVLALLVTL